MPQANEQDATPAASISTPANTPSLEAGVTQTENIPAVDSSPTTSVAATNAEASEASEVQPQVPKANRTIRLVTPTGEITLATEESVFSGEYVLEVHRDDELLGSAKITVE